MSFALKCTIQVKQTSDNILPVVIPNVNLCTSCHKNTRVPLMIHTPICISVGKKKHSEKTKFIKLLCSIFLENSNTSIARRIQFPGIGTHPTDTIPKHGWHSAFSLLLLLTSSVIVSYRSYSVKHKKREEKRVEEKGQRKNGAKCKIYKLVHTTRIMIVCPAY